MNVKEIGELAVNAFYSALYETGLSYKYEKGTITQKEKDAYIEMIKEDNDRLRKLNQEYSDMISKYVTGGK